MSLSGIPAGTRGSPQRDGRKGCSRRESPSIPAQPASVKTGLSRRRSRVRVPSLPLKSLQIGTMRCPFRRRIWSDYTDFRSRRPETAKSSPKPVVGLGFQADSDRIEADSEGRVRLHEMAGGQRSASFVSRRGGPVGPAMAPTVFASSTACTGAPQGSSWSGRVRAPEDVSAKARTMGWRSLALRRSSPSIC